MTLDPYSYVPGLDDNGWADTESILAEGWKPDGPWRTGAAWLADTAIPQQLVLRANGPVRWDDADTALVDLSLKGQPTLLCEGQFLAVEAAASALRLLPIPGGVTEPRLAFEDELRRLFGPTASIAHRPSICEALIAAETLHPHPGRRNAVRLGGLPGYHALGLPAPEPEADLDAWLADVGRFLEPHPESGTASHGVGVVLIAPFTLDPSLRPLPAEAARLLSELAQERDMLVVADLRRWAPARSGCVDVGFGADVALLDGDLTGGLADVGCLVGDLPDGFDPGSVRPSDAAAAAEVLRQIREDGLCRSARDVSSFLERKLEPFTALGWVRDVSSAGSYCTVTCEEAGPMLAWVDQMRSRGVRVEDTARGVTFALPVDAPPELLLRICEIAMVSAGLVVEAPPGDAHPLAS